MQRVIRDLQKLSRTFAYQTTGLEIKCYKSVDRDVANVRLSRSGHRNINLRVRQAFAIAKDVPRRYVRICQVAVCKSWVDLVDWSTRKFRIDLDRAGSSHSKLHARHTIPNLQNALDVIVTQHIATKRQTNFDFWARMINFKLFPAYSKDGLFRHYTAWEPGHQEVLVIRCKTRLDPTNVLVDVDDVEISTPGGCWASFLDWLDRKPEFAPTIPSYTIQEWWESNGLTFRFLDLPPELRENIYFQITGPFLWPHPSRAARTQAPTSKFLRYFNPCDIEWTRSNDIRWNRSSDGHQFLLDPSGGRPPQPSAIVSVSKQLEAEFWANAHRSTTKHFQNLDTLRYVLQANPAVCLRRISLGLTNKMYFQLLGIQWAFRQGFVQTNNRPIDLLSTMAAIKDLNFHFQIAQISYSAEFYPFVTMHGGRLGHELSCQKILVDWFLTLAHAYIRHIPRIAITGHVKNSTRMKWEAIYADERNDTHHDMSAAVQPILSTPWQHL